MRHLCMRAPDRAEARLTAAASVAELARLLGNASLAPLGAFLLRLSRSARPCQRLVAIEAAQAMLHGLPAPFRARAGYASFNTAQHPADEVGRPHLTRAHRVCISAYP